MSDDGEYNPLLSFSDFQKKVEEQRDKVLGEGSLPLVPDVGPSPLLTWDDHQRLLNEG
jgi:hypothetical protein